MIASVGQVSDPTSPASDGLQGERAVDRYGALAGGQVTSKPSSASLPAPVNLSPPDLVVKACFDGMRFGLQLAHVPGLSKPLERHGAWWSAARRMWLVRATGAADVESMLLDAYSGQHVSFDALAAALRASAAAPEPDFYTQLLDVQVFPLAKGDGGRGKWAVSFVYDPPCVAAMRAMRGLFHKHAAAWQVHCDPAEIQEHLVRHAGVKAEFVFVHEQAVVLEELATASASSSPIVVPAAPPPQRGGGGGDDSAGTGFFSTDVQRSGDLPFDASAVASLVATGVLRDYQAIGVQHMLRSAGACMGDDMGLGKSRQTVVASRLAAGKGRVLIVCPASLRLNWEREIRMVYPEATVGMVGEDRIATLQACDWVIGNYERMGGLVRATELAFEVMAVDEAHYLKEYQSGRTRNVFLLAARIPRCYVVTGTPLLNREVEMHTLLRITGHALGQLPLGDFRKGFAGTAEKRAKLADAIKGWMIRRSKAVLSDLGKKDRQLRYLSPEGLGTYREIYRDMSLQAMPKIVQLRRTLESLKVPFLLDTVQSMGDDDKIIIFCEYMSTVDALKQALAGLGIGCVSLVGADSAKKRQAAVDAFQQVPSNKVFIGTTSAAGVGITLTAANLVAFASMPWTPALMRQAEDRAYRLGQLRDVLVIVPIVPGTIDEGVLKLQDAKRTTEVEVVEAAKAALPDAQQLELVELPAAAREERAVLEFA
ncbi:DEAD/DEAH box helicase [Paracidovorax oryzae]|uniref:DEAD/DEAH box helicase n=1 Tax=Paracidovorax oryzae TaxID=862720 RepID=UPI001FD5D575|nr:DEAD/DEAH box helicase [Paracidovorax oryzae]